MHRLHFKYDYLAAILENQLRDITPELMAGSTPNFNHRYIYPLGIFYWPFHLNLKLKQHEDAPDIWQSH
jgi:hypothetical protein